MQYTICDLTLGQTASVTEHITADRVKAYAEVTGDYNPVHLDEEYAAKTRYGRCIAHGELLNGFISKLLGMELPGEGCIYVKQELSFTAPVYINDYITTELTVTALNYEKNRATIKTVCKNQTGTIVATGVAVVLPSTE